MSGQGISNLYQGGWKARIAFWSPPSKIVPQCSIAGGATPPWAPRRGRRSPDIGSVLVRAVFVPIWAPSHAVPTGLLEGWYPANTDLHLSRTRAPGVVGGIGSRRCAFGRPRPRSGSAGNQGTVIHPFFYPPKKDTNSTLTRAASLACGPRRAVRAPMCDAEAPSR